ncbi:TetR/AcrR family transcriptional regulator [Rhodococcoides corynebacterioides]|uniref:TetR/AcrR family transcriptional regulator n=1 Tax=Rhodococcoides corynebacterioides TaxID=53972 RepID=UPI00082CB8A8|nr:TetR/AcrR family transcriptional regulator [Rhodococcus corynebacterioides]
MHTDSTATERSAVPATRAARKAASRARILAAARDLFEDRDFDAVTVGEIADRAGVAHGSVFHHFESKKGVYRAVLDAVVDEMDAAFDDSMDAADLDSVRRGLRAHLMYAAQHRGLATRLVLGRRSTDPDVRAASERGRERVLTAIALVLGIDPSREANIFVGRVMATAFDEATVLWLESDGTLPAHALVDWMIEMMEAAIDAVPTLEGRTGRRSLPGF